MSFIRDVQAHYPEREPADPIVQAPEDAQSLNRYSYVLNNPLSYTDPTGYECGMVHGALTRDCVFGLDNEENTNSGDTDTQGQSDHRDTNSANQSDSLSNSASRAGGEIVEEEEETWGFWDSVQTGLDVLGMAPIVGNIADIANAGISVARGDYAGAALSVGAAIPGAGLAVGGGKFATNAAKRLKKANQNRRSPCPLSCFVAGTLVLTPTGYMAIEQLAVGDEVLAYHTETGEQAYKPITATWTVEDKAIYRVTVTNTAGISQTIDATQSHPFFVLDADAHKTGHTGQVAQGSWLTTTELTADSILMDEQQGLLFVRSIVDLNQKQTAYNFTVADFHTYYVTQHNVLVHNCDDKVGEANAVVPKGAKDRIRVQDITNPGAKSPNFQVDKTRSQFEKHLTDNGFDKKSVSTPKGDINIFSKNGQKEFTTRGFSKSTDGPSGEIFTGGSNRASAKIRFLDE